MGRSEPRKRLRFKAVAGVALAVALPLALVSVVLSLPPPPGMPAMPYQAITFGSWNDTSPAWSPDGKLIAYASDRNGMHQLFVMNPDDTGTKPITPSSYNATNPSWSPDSSAIAFVGYNASRASVRVIFLANSSVRTIEAAGPPSIQEGATWSPDGKRLLFFVAANGTRLVSYDIETMTQTVVATASGNHVSACWTSNTAVVYSSLANGSYALMWTDVSNGTRGVLHEGTESYTAPIFSSSTSKLAFISNLVPGYPSEFGEAFAYSQGDFNLWVSNLNGTGATYQYGLAPAPGQEASGVELLMFPYTPAKISPYQELAWSADGKLLAYVAQTSVYGDCLFLWQAGTDTGSVGAVGPVNATVASPTWSPDNLHLAFVATVNGRTQIYSMDTSQVGMNIQYGTIHSPTGAGGSDEEGEG